MKKDVTYELVITDITGTSDASLAAYPPGILLGGINLPTFYIQEYNCFWGVSGQDMTEQLNSKLLLMEATKLPPPGFGTPAWSPKEHTGLFNQARKLLRFWPGGKRRCITGFWMHLPIIPIHQSSPQSPAFNGLFKPVYVELN
ncbi:MAG: hypothetical protein GY751_15005 [Bacteroidetes bacterium]|nr:hypothetical protein [Bacteroidota bacterium]